MGSMYGAMKSGRYQFYGWQSIAEAIRAAYEVTGERQSGQRREAIPQRDWNLIGTAIEQHADQGRPKCLHCTGRIDAGNDIRCFDCRAVMCPPCAEKHFWPNGRVKA